MNLVSEKVRPGGVTWLDPEAQINNAAECLRLSRLQAESDEARLLKLLCDKFGCHPGMRVIRTDTKKRTEWIVTKAFLRHHEPSVERPYIWAKRADRHNQGNPHHEMQLWWHWEAAPT